MTQHDNMKTAVNAVFIGKERAYNRRFLEMCSHHLVEPVACTPRAGWEKGQVEKQVDHLRGRLFVPRPRGKSYAEINVWLTDQCIRDAKRNLVLVGGTGTGKTHLAVAIVRACIRNGARSRCHNVVELVNNLEAELRSGRQGRTAEQHTRRDFILLDELGYLPFAPRIVFGPEASCSST